MHTPSFSSLNALVRPTLAGAAALLAAIVTLSASGARTPQDASQAQDAAAQAKDRPVRVASYNIHHGSGNDTCTPPTPSTPPSAECALNLERIGDVIRDLDVDVIGLQEVDRFWGRSGVVDQPAALARQLRMHVCYGANLDHQPDNHASQPHQYGTAILSRRPILSCENSLLPRANPNSEQRGLLHARINVRGVPLHFYNTHLHTQAADRAVQIPALDALVSDTAPAIIVGDFNAQPTEAPLAPLQARFQDLWPTIGSGNGFTFPASPTTPPNRRIDYIFLSRDITATGAAVAIDVTTTMAADHLPLVADALLPGSAVGIGHDR